MSVGGVCYPITEEVRAALEIHPNIGALFNLPRAGRSELEIVRLLDNTHYANVKNLLGFVDRMAPGAGTIAQRVLKQTDPFQLRQAMAELYLLAHLQDHSSGTVRPAASASSVTHPDIEILLSDLDVMVEVYCPVDLMGFQLIEEYTSTLLKYVDVDRGFTLDVDLRLAKDSDPFYPYGIGDEKVIRPWLTTLADEVGSWLGAKVPRQLLTVDGPDSNWYLEIRVRELVANPRERLVAMSTPTRSTDTRLFFEVGTVEDIARSEWGKRFSRKLWRRQCGNLAPKKLRVLVVDFSLADTGWPDFICWPEIVERMGQVVVTLADRPGEPPPYDTVIPARLGLECRFAPPSWLNPRAKEVGNAFFESAKFTRPWPGVNTPSG